MDSAGINKSNFEKFLYRPDLLANKQPGKALLVALDCLFGILTLGTVHLGFAIKHVFHDLSSSSTSLIERIRNLSDTALYQSKKTHSTPERSRAKMQEAQDLLAQQKERMHTIQEGTAEILEKPSEEQIRKITELTDQLIPALKAATKDFTSHKEEIDGLFKKLEDAIQGLPQKSAYTTGLRETLRLQKQLWEELKTKA